MRFHQDGVYVKSPETFLRNAIVGVRIELDNPKSSYKQAYISIDDRFFRTRPSHQKYGTEGDACSAPWLLQVQQKQIA